MHLSQRRTPAPEGPTPPRLHAPRRTRTASVGSMGPRTTDSRFNKRVRTRDVSLSGSSTDDKRPIAPSSTAAESVTENFIALPKPAPISRCGADCGTDNSSLPSLAASPQIARNKTFIYMYDESEKKSKAVKSPDELNISLPVLVQYELTEEETDAGKLRPQEPSNDPLGDSTEQAPEANTAYMSPTIELLRKWDKTEKRNKGLHVMRWLVQVQN